MTRLYFVAALSLLLAATAFAGNTGGYRGPDNAGVYEAEGLLESWPEGGPERLWKYDIGVGYGGVTVADGQVYVAGGELSHLYVFSLEGQLLKRLPIGGAGWKRFSGARSTPLVRDEMVVTTTPDANLYGVNVDKGEIRWKKNAWRDFGAGKGHMGWGLPSSPMRVGRKVIFNTCSRFDETPPIVAIDIETGETIWEADAETGRKFSAGDCSGAAFNHNGRTIVAYPTWRSFLVLDAETGRKLWELPNPKGSEKELTPVYADGYLLTMPRGGVARMVRLNSEGDEPTPLWQRPWRAGYSHAVILNGRVYLFGRPGDPVTRFDDKGNPIDDGKSSRRRKRAPNELLCIDAETGKVLHHTPAGTAGHIIAADGKVYAVDLVKTSGKVPRPRVSLLKPTEKGFELAGRFIPELTDADVSVKDVEWQGRVNPVIAEGRLFLRYGPLMAYELRADRAAQIHKRKARVAELAERLDARDAGERLAALRALAEMGWKARPAAGKIGASLDDEDPRVRKLAAKILGAVGPSAAKILIEAMDRERVWKDGHAADALVESLEADDLALALAAAAEANRSVREQIAPLIAKLGRPAVDPLVRLIRTGDRRLRWWAIQTLKPLGPDAGGATEVLIGQVRTGNQWFRALAARVLGEIGPKAAPAGGALVKLLSHSYPDARAAAAEALGKIGVSNARVLAALEKASKDGKEPVAAAAVKALETLKAEE